MPNVCPVQHRTAIRCCGGGTAASELMLQRLLDCPAPPPSASNKPVSLLHVSCRPFPPPEPTSKYSHRQAGLSCHLRGLVVCALAILPNLRAVQVPAWVALANAACLQMRRSWMAQYVGLYSILLPAFAAVGKPLQSGVPPQLRTLRRCLPHSVLSVPRPLIPKLKHSAAFISSAVQAKGVPSLRTRTWINAAPSATPSYFKLTFPYSACMAPPRRHPGWLKSSPCSCWPWRPDEPRHCARPPSPGWSQWGEVVERLSLLSCCCLRPRAASGIAERFLRPDCLTDTCRAVASGRKLMQSCGSTQVKCNGYCCSE